MNTNTNNSIEEDSDRALSEALHSMAINAGKSNEFLEIKFSVPDDDLGFMLKGLDSDRLDSENDEK